MTTLLPFRIRASRRRAWLASLGLLVTLSIAAAQGDATPPTDAQAAVAAAPADPAAWVALGDTHMAAENPDAAMHAYLEAIALDYRVCEAHYGLGVAAYARSDLDAALFSFEEVSRLCPERFDGHYNRAVTLARLQRPHDAASAFERALEAAEPEATRDDRVAALGGLASQLARTDAFDAAADAYARARTLRPEDDELAYLHGDALWRAGRGLEALPDLTALETRTEEPRFTILIAEVYRSAERTAYALRTLDRAITRARQASDGTREAELQLRRGALLRDLGRGEEATNALREASRLDPDRFETHYALGVSLLEAGDHGDARDVLLTARAYAGEDDVLVSFALAEAFELLDQPANALREAERVLSLLPPDTDREATLTRADALLLAGRNAFRTEAFDLALGYLQDVQTLRRDDPVVHAWVGLAAYRLGAFADAAHAFERALTLDPDDRVARQNLAAAYLADGRYREAVDAYLLLVEQAPDDARNAYHLGWAHIGLEDRASARDVWASACEVGYRDACDALAEMF